MNLIVMVFLISAAPAAPVSAGDIMAAVIPFIVVACVIVPVFLLRRRQKRRTHDV